MIHAANGGIANQPQSYATSGEAYDHTVTITVTGILPGPGSLPRPSCPPQNPSNLLDGFIS